MPRVRQQVPPLRCAPVGITILLNPQHVNRRKLQPGDRIVIPTEVEGPAILPSRNNSDPGPPFSPCHPKRREGSGVYSGLICRLDQTTCLPARR
jgi:hypothetical protein